MAGKPERYLKLIKANTIYAKHMRELSRTIFNEPPLELRPKNRKVITLFSQKPVNKRPEIVDYYLTNNNIEKLTKQLSDYGLYRDLHLEFTAYTEKKRQERGKMPWVPPRFRDGANKK